MLGLSYEDEKVLHEELSIWMLYLSLPVFVVLYFILPSSPWGKTLSLGERGMMTSSKNDSTGATGKHGTSKYEIEYRWGYFGPLLPARISWFLFEFPNLYWSYLCWNDRNDQGGWSSSTDGTARVRGFLLMLFAAHYVQRALIYPMAMNSKTKPMPSLVVLSAFLYTNVNGYLQARSVCTFQQFTERKYGNASFWIGFVLFVAGMRINLQSDAILRNLRYRREQKQTQEQQPKSKQSADDRDGGNYAIPYGGWFEYVSAPHYLGEIIEWIGYAMMCRWSLPSVSFAVFTMSNLVPRAVSHHRWYRSHFRETYPQQRKAVIPFIW